MKKCILTTFLVLTCMLAGAEIKLPKLVSDGMVLQRNAKVNIWGQAAAGKSVTVVTSWDGAKYRTSADSDGNWCVSAVTGEAGGPYSITIKDGDRDKVTVSDVMVGEVWICSGQSNMGMPLMGYPAQPVEGALEEYVKAPSHHNLRLFKVIPTLCEDYQEDVNAGWSRPTMAEAANFSALGFLFGAGLADNLDVTVGMIESDAGGTRIEAWMSEEAILPVIPDNAKSDEGRAAIDPNRTAILWKSMIYPLRKYAAKGFLWYQGESNKGQYKVYAQLQASLVKLWRDTWTENGTDGQSMFFFFSQLAPFDHNNPYDRINGKKNDILIPLMWEAQRRALDLIPLSDMAYCVDLGHGSFIHPPRKKELAERFLLLAMKHAYDVFAIPSMDWRGPIFKGVSFDGCEAIVEFDSPSMLCPVDPLNTPVPILGFELAGADRVFQRADAVIIQRDYNFSKKVRVTCAEVPEPVAVRYAFDNVPGELNLTNTIGLPAYPFRTDDWDDVQ